MKRFLTIICASLLLQCAYGADKKVLFLKDNVNLRSDPSTSAAIEGKMSRGGMLDFVDEENGWIMVVYPDTRDSVAFVSASLVTVVCRTPVTKEAFSRGYTPLGQLSDTWYDGYLYFDASRFPYVAVSESWSRVDVDGNPISASVNNKIWRFISDGRADIYTGTNIYMFDDSNVTIQKIMADEEKLESGAEIFYNDKLKLFCIPCTYFNAAGNIVNGGMAFQWENM